MGKNQHVVMHDERWAVKEEGASAPVAIFKTQGQAWEKAKAIARRERSEAVLHGKDGRRLLYADRDGYLTGDFDGDVLNFCYAHAGGPSQTSVVSCTEVKRSR